MEGLQRKCIGRGGPDAEGECVGHGGPDAKDVMGAAALWRRMLAPR